MPRDARVVFAIDHFLHGLSSYDMKKHVHFSHPKTLDEAITLAIEYERFESSIEMPMQTAVLCKVKKRSYKARQTKYWQKWKYIAPSQRNNGRFSKVSGINLQNAKATPVSSSL